MARYVMLEDDEIGLFWDEPHFGAVTNGEGRGRPRQLHEPVCCLLISEVFITSYPYMYVCQPSRVTLLVQFACSSSAAPPYLLFNRLIIWMSAVTAFEAKLGVLRP